MKQWGCAMAEKSRIEWTDATWNPTTGCTKVSPGCKRCYAELEWARLAANPKTVYFGRAFTDVQIHADRLGTPLRWAKPRRIFVDAMSDLFHEDVPSAFIAEVFGVMAGCPQHTFQLLTKRPERMLELMNAPWFQQMVRDFVAGWPEAETMTWPLANVWLGVSAEDQETADRRIPLLLDTPAAVRWVSLEPLLGPVTLTDVPNNLGVAEGQRHIDALGGFAWECDGPSYVDTCGIGSRIDWVVVGGESGQKARPMHPDWVRSLRDQCEDYCVPFNFKQWGEFQLSKSGCEVIESNESGAPLAAWPDGQIANGTAEQHGGPGTLIHRVGKKAAGRLLDGRLHDAFPEASHA